MSAVSKISTAIDMVRARDREGFHATLTRSLLPAALFRVNEQAILRLRRRPELPRPLDRIRIRWASPADEEALQRVRRREHGYAANFEQGSCCLLGEVDGEPASFNWFELGDWHVSKTNAYRFRLGANAAWAWGFEIVPRFRLSGLFVKQWAVAVDELARSGIDTIYGAVVTDNHSSLAAHLHVGFEELCRFRVTRFAGLVHHRVVPGPARQLEATSGWGVWIGRDPGGDSAGSDR